MDGVRRDNASIPGEAHGHSLAGLERTNHAPHYEAFAGEQKRQTTADVLG